MKWIPERFSRQELGAVLDIYHDSMLLLHMQVLPVAPQIRADVMWAIDQKGLDRKWGIDGPALVNKLRSLDERQARELAFTIVRFWDVGRLDLTGFYKLLAEE